MAGSFSLEDLTDEQRQKLLEDFAPGPLSTGPMARGAQGFAPLPLPKGLGDGFESSPARAGIDPDLFARFAAAQQRGSKLDALNALGHGFGADAALIAGTGVNTIERDARRRGQPMAELSARLGAERSIQQLDRQREIDAVTLAKTKADTRKSEVAATASEADAKREAALADPKSPESNALRATASELLKGRITPETLATMSGVQLRDALKYGTSMVNAESMGAFREAQLEQSAKNAALDRQLRAEALAQGWDIANMTAEQREWMFNRDAELRKELAELASQKEAAKHERDRGEKTQELVAKDIKGISDEFDSMGGPGFYSRYAEAKDIIERNKQDLPGVGKGAGLLPNFFISEEGNSLRSAVGQMLAEYRKSVTGAGMSNSEREEFATITGLLSSTREDTYMRGVDRLKRAMDTRVRARARGFSPEAVRKYAEREPLFGAIMAGEVVPESSPDGSYSGSPKVGTRENPSRGPSTFEPMPTAPAAGKAAPKRQPPKGSQKPKAATQAQPSSTSKVEFEELGPEDPKSEKNPPWMPFLKEGQKAKDVIPRGTYAKVPMTDAKRNGPFRIVYHTNSGKLVNVDGD